MRLKNATTQKMHLFRVDLTDPANPNLGLLRRLDPNESVILPGGMIRTVQTEIHEGQVVMLFEALGGVVLGEDDFPIGGNGLIHDPDDGTGLVPASGGNGGGGGGGAPS